MPYPKLNALLLPTLTLLVGFFAVLAAAEQDYVADCPYTNDVQEIVYSPFKPYFRGIPGADIQKCWFWASCTLSLADPSRQQQFGATALVMGLIAPTFKDIAWPGRRIIQMSDKLPFYTDVAVRALGLDPRSPGSGDHAGKEKVRKWWANSSLAQRTWQRPMIWAIAMCLPLLVTGGGLALIETFSKRASLGCVYPIYVLTWFILALLPAAVHTVCSRIRLRRKSSPTRELSEEEITAVQGGDEIWLVQLMWAIYYIAGTLVYTSVMAVTVVELAVWVALSAAFTASCKMLAFFLCLMNEPQAHSTSEPGGQTLLGQPSNYKVPATHASA